MRLRQKRTWGAGWQDAVGGFGREGGCREWRLPPPEPRRPVPPVIRVPAPVPPQPLGQQRIAQAPALCRRPQPPLVVDHLHPRRRPATPGAAEPSRQPQLAHGGRPRDDRHPRPLDRRVPPAGSAADPQQITVPPDGLDGEQPIRRGRPRLNAPQRHSHPQPLSRFGLRVSWLTCAVRAPHSQTNRRDSPSPGRARPANRRAASITASWPQPGRRQRTCRKRTVVGSGEAGGAGKGLKLSSRSHPTEQG